MMKGSSAALAAAAPAGEGALGAKTARACDSCLKRRARWFCGADDAFLCHSCDTLVHSANQLASRHERVRLQTASSAKVTTWHSGFTRKARTPRHNKHLNLQQQRLKDQVLFNSSILPLVPELGREEEEELEQEQPLVDYDLLCRVPVFNVDDIYNTTTTTVKNDEDQFEACDELESFSEFDVDLAEFAANVESLLGVGSSTDLHHEGEKSNNINTSLTAGAAGKVKDEVDDLEEEYSVFDMTISTDEMFHWNIDDDSSHHQEEKDEYYCEELVVGGGGSNTNNNKEERKRERFLRLNYEEVISAWTSSQGCNSSPWTTGNPPPNNNNFTFTIDDDSWPNYLGTNDEEVVMNRSLRGKYLLGSSTSTSSSGDGGREARVSRYREKRRTRLFAKKIRYEVRKLNAEKRPRMKGRFVKRSNFVGVGANTTTTTTDHHFPTNYH